MKSSKALLKLLAVGCIGLGCLMPTVVHGERVVEQPKTDSALVKTEMPSGVNRIQLLKSDEMSTSVRTSSIANGHAYASGKNMGINSSLTIGNAGYFNPVDITVRSQDSAQSDIYYCIDQIAGMMGTVEQDHSPVYNIVQDGNKIYVLYG